VQQIAHCATEVTELIHICQRNPDIKRQSFGASCTVRNTEDPQDRATFTSVYECVASVSLSGRSQTLMPYRTPINKHITLYRRPVFPPKRILLT